MKINGKWRFRAIFFLFFWVSVGLLLLEVQLIQSLNYPLTSITVGALVVISIFSLIHYVEHHFRVVEHFFSSARSGDFSHKINRTPYSEYLREEYNLLNAKYETELSSEKSENMFLRALIRQAPVAIFAYDDLQRIYFFNAEASKLFNLSSPSKLKDLDSILVGFSSMLVASDEGSRSLVKTKKEGLDMSLSVSKTKVLLDNKYQVLVTIENIEQELVRVEDQAWRRLVSVMTHEVMNSVTPITSLARTSFDILNQDGLMTLPRNQMQDELQDATRALKTIADRSEAIVGFVESYRKLGMFPEPNMSELNVKTFLLAMAALHKEELGTNSVRINTDCEEASMAIQVDVSQLEHVFLNLIKNGLEASIGQTERVITLIGRKTTNGCVLSVLDQGEGMDSKTLEKIFVPFFTTKRSGSGIGMPLVRQLVHANQGQIAVHSELGKGTRIDLAFDILQ